MMAVTLLFHQSVYNLPQLYGTSFHSPYLLHIWMFHTIEQTLSALLVPKGHYPVTSYLNIHKTLILGFPVTGKNQSGFVSCLYPVILCPDCSMAHAFSAKEFSRSHT